ncbi:mitochondrial fission ELM1 family protein [Chiayiivirga flava]|uniref:Nucleoside-diphosphate sugar epimerase n=1 Tax=Chiayiivirga flava TaxID=659595 RepID=A0A7W8D7H4_9GAMM|nr:mitochondrial fission ELM1 family protein [Chiayiivirga flava]MBB5208127.1 hypothetical protein [Chiayiivirga flava]
MSISPTAWVITDGAAGNEKQALALAAALDCPSVTIRLATSAPWRWAAPHLIPPQAATFGPSVATHFDSEPPRLAIGCGRQAALALRWLKRRHGNTIRTVQILDPRIDPRHFDAVVVPEHDALREPNVLTTLGALNAIDDAWLAQARDAWPTLRALPSPRTAVLLGGPTRAYALDRAAWAALAAQLRTQHARDDGSLLVTTSRRSPDWLRRAARADLADLPGVQWHGDTDGPNPYAGMLAIADRIVVTPDSINLVSEACATHAAVWVPDIAAVRGKTEAFLADLLARQRIAAPGRDTDRTPLRETARIAAELQSRLLR